MPLPRLRHDLDFLPSPVEERPGLLIRDPLGYSDTTLIVPPLLVQALTFFDGVREEGDLRQFLFEITQDLQSGELIGYLRQTLSDAGFLDDEAFAARREARQREFAQLPVREALHAGAGYPGDPAQLKTVFDQYLSPPTPAGSTITGNGDGAHRSGLIGIAAPHVSPFGGVDAYRAAYAALGPQYRDRTFVILGTSHYGMPDLLGLTRKDFSTPYGQARTAVDLVTRLERDAGQAAIVEDYCHAIEHSIEFQVVFLQHLYGPDVRILPVLCGSYARSIYLGGKPEDSDDVKRILGALGELAAREGDRLFWVLGVDMAHIGRRYGDDLAARAHAGYMTEVAERDRARIRSIETGDAAGFWDQVQQNRDDLKWCGSSPFYTFLKALPEARGELFHYQQWNIDDQSVVSFAGLGFRNSL